MNEEEESKKRFFHRQRIYEAIQDILHKSDCCLDDIRILGMNLIQLSIQEAIKHGLPLKQAKKDTEGIEDKIYEQVVKNLKKKNNL